MDSKDSLNLLTPKGSKKPDSKNEFSATRPLPPIGSVDKGEESDIDEKTSEGTRSDARSSISQGSTSEGNRPRVLRGFRPEVYSDDEDFEDDKKLARRVSFTEVKERMFRTKSPAIRETNKRRTYDGREVTFVSLDTQTDWDWVSDIEAGTNRTYDSEKSTTEDAQSGAVPKSETIEESQEEPVQPGAEGGLYPMPYNDEYGIPILDLSSDTDDYQRESEKHEIDVEDPESRLPKIDSEDEEELEKDEHGMTHGMFSGSCEFCKKEVLPFPTIEQQQQFPPEQLYCCNEYREFVEYVLSESKELEEAEKKKNKMISVKVHEHVGSKQERNAAKEKAVQRMRERELQRRAQEASGLQQNFFASMQKAGAGSLSSGSKGFLKLGGPNLLNDILADLGNELPEGLKEGHVADLSITEPDCVPDCIGYKRRLQREKSGGSVGSVAEKRHSEYCDAFRLAQYVSNFINEMKESAGVARQMKTINYQLSSQKCLEEGWTLRAPSPLLEDLGDNVFEPEPLDPAMVAEGRLRERPLIEKFYEAGQKFLTMFPDGTGNVFYPSGNLAILITSVKLGQYHYTIHQDVKRAGVAAAFEPSGYGYCYYPNGDVRLYIDQYGGIELDPSGGKKRKWQWKDHVTHVHAPPFQPICLGLNRNMAVRVMSQENIVLTFSANQRSCRFNMGSRLKGKSIWENMQITPYLPIYKSRGKKGARKQLILPQVRSSRKLQGIAAGLLGRHDDDGEVGQILASEKSSLLGSLEEEGEISEDPEQPHVQYSSRKLQDTAGLLGKLDGEGGQIREKSSFLGRFVNEGTISEALKLPQLVAPENLPLKEIEEDFIFLEEKKNYVGTLLDKVSTLLKFPNSPKIDKILPPLHVTNKISKTERLKKERKSLLAQQSARDKKQPAISVS